jgi:outer membrane protein TolC
MEISEAVRRTNIQAQLGLPFAGFPKHIGPFWVFQGGPSFSVPLLDLTAYRRWRAAQEDINGSRAEQISARELNVQLVVSQYLGTLRAAADITAARSRMDVAKALLDLAADMQRNGAGTRIDTARADVQYQNERQNVLVAETLYKTSLYALARLLDVDPRTPIELTDQKSFFETPAFEGNTTVETAFANRPELQAVESRLRSLHLQRRATADQRLPRLSITGEWAEQGLSPGSAIPTYNYQGNIDIPLFTGGRIRAQQAVADLEVQKAEQDRQDTRNRVAVEVQTALAELDSARNQVDVANHALDLAREVLGQARDRFQAGVANNIEVIQAQDDVARANDNQIQALYRYNQARADLARSTGQIERTYTK